MNMSITTIYGNTLELNNYPQGIGLWKTSPLFACKGQTTFKLGLRDTEPNLTRKQIAADREMRRARRTTRTIN